MHVVAAEAESGKTWFALAAVNVELKRGNSCVYLDFEDDEGGIVGRLLTMGCDREAIRKQFIYIRPEGPINRGAINRVDLQDVLTSYRPTLVILDGVTEAMSLHDLDLKDNAHVAQFGRILPAFIAAFGPAVVALDHVVKDRESRGRYAIGGVHKLNGLNGAMYLLENKQPFGIGLTGRSRLSVVKDRPAQLRRNGLPAGDGQCWYADLVVQSHDETFAEVTLPSAERRANAVFRPTGLMKQVSDLLAGAPKGMSKKAIEQNIRGKAETIRYAVEILIGEGFVTVERQGSANLHKLVKPYNDDT